MSTRSIFWTVASAVILLTKILSAIIVHGYMEGRDVKITCGGTSLEFKVKKSEKLLIEKLTRRKPFELKSDTM